LTTSRDRWFPKRRLRKKDKDEVKTILAENNNQHCYICGVDMSLDKLELEHLNGNPSDNRLENLRLACHPCNAREYQRQRHQASLTQLHKDIDTKPTDGTSLIHERIDYSRGSIEMQTNDFAEEPYRNWLISQVKLNNRIEYSEAVNSGAELHGVSTTTVYRYTSKITSEKGPLERVKDKEQKVTYIVARQATLAKWKPELEESNQALKDAENRKVT